MNSRTKVLFGLFCGCLMLGSAAVYNGYPMVYVDSYDYIGMAVDGYKLWARPIYYSYLIYPLHVERTLWPVVFAQAFMMGHLVHLVLRLFFGSARMIPYLSIMAGLTFLTALPWITGYIMADVFTSVVVLTIFLLGFARENLARWEKAYLFILCAVATATHQSHVSLGLCLAAVMLVLRKATGRSFLRLITDSIWVVSALLLAFAAIAFSNAVFHGAHRATGYGQIFALTRFLDDGPAYTYLRDHCGEKEYVLCDYMDEIRNPHSKRFLKWFKWNEESPIYRGGGPESIADEASEIVWGSIRARPLDHLKNALQHTCELLVHFETGSGMRAFPPTDPEDGWLLPAISGYIPKEREALYNARQHSGTIPFDMMNKLHKPVVWLSFLLCLTCLVPLLNRRDQVPAVFILMVIAGLLVNAFVCGSIAGTHARLQARVVWLLVLAAILTSIRLFHSLRDSSSF